MNLKTLYLVFFGAISLFSQQKDHRNIRTFSVKSKTNKYPSQTHYLKDKITISFDDLDGDQKDYYYNIKHCNINWTSSDLMESQFLNGFNNIFIDEFENSFATLANYTHYSFTLPNEQTQITRSGNYIIEILDEDEHIVFKQKIILISPKINVEIKTSTSRNLVEFNKKQAVSLTISTQNLKVNFPKEEIKTFIFQNNDINLCSNYLEPTFTNQNTIIYRPSNETEFFAGNEFLWFDNHNILVNTNTIYKNYRVDNEFQTILIPNKARKNKIYVYNPDINGQFVIRNSNNSNIETESEYSWVHFSLKEEIKTDKEIYVYGAFNNFAFTEENKLKANPENNLLSTKIYLKQGFYNYDFVTLDGNIEKHTISGSFFETENNYKAIVYFKPMGSMFYEVVGLGSANSKQQVEN